MPVIELENVSKSFRSSTEAKLLREHVTERLQRRDSRLFHALKDISFQVEAGESVAIVGANGAGKSTLFSLIAGLSLPTSGQVRVSGRISALLELGSGFHPDLTGRENVMLNAALLGLTRARTEECFDAIVEFAEMEEFVENPLRTYSDGMVMRLAFSAAVHVDPDILLIDEVLAVGDHAFSEKCMERMLAFRRQGKTMVVASHVFETLQQLCDRALWLDHGQLVAAGEAREVLAAYFERKAASRP